MEVNITGRYRHYKGNEYEVIGEGTHSETGEKFVVYMVQGESPTIWIRPYDMFFETITVDGRETPRFRKLED